MSEFSRKVIQWQRRDGRHDLPWQNTRDPYRIWLSEVMLQQTQVTTVIPYFQRFLARFPDIRALGEADEESVLAHWSGLGYYARARNLHRAALMVVEQYGGAFPSDFQAIAAFPGIGRSTAGAIAVFAFGQRHPILDGNVKRVLTRVFAVSGYTGDTAVADRLWALAAELLPRHDVEAYTQGLMDLGATLCLRHNPRCEACPLQGLCQAHAAGSVHQYPFSRPSRKLPERKVQMLVVSHGRHLLLEKRPRGGVWAGLWSFPETAPGEDPVRALERRWGIAAMPQVALAPLRHAFTHYRLLIEPLCLQAEQRTNPSGDGSASWMDRENLLSAAIPTPVRNLLKLLDEFAVDDPNGIF